MKLGKTKFALIDAFNLVALRFGEVELRLCVFPCAAGADGCLLIVRLLANASLQASNHLSNVTV